MSTLSTSQDNSAKAKSMRLKNTIKKVWPSMGSFSGGQEQMSFTITMDDVYRTYSADQNPKRLFEKALQWLTTIQLSEEDFEKRAAKIESQLQESILRSIYGSNQIERVGLGLDETFKLCRRILAGEEVEQIDERTPEYEKKLLELYSKQPGSDYGTLPLKAFVRGRQEVINHAKAFQYMLDWVVSLDLQITEELIKTTHRILCQDTPIYNADKTITQPDNYAGIYRDVTNTHVGAGTTMFTVPKMVPGSMKRMIENLNNDLKIAREKNEIDPFALASKYCLEFVQIHPFADGNGRVCRMLLNVILCKYAGIVVPIGEVKEDREEYINIKKRASAEAHGHGELATFVLQKSETRLRTTKKKINSRPGKKN